MQDEIEAEGVGASRGHADPQPINGDEPRKMQELIEKRQDVWLRSLGIQLDLLLMLSAWTGFQVQLDIRLSRHGFELLQEAAVDGRRLPGEIGAI